MAASSGPSAAEKAERKRERIRKRVSEAQDRISSGVEEIRDSAAFRAYLTSLARFHRYSAFNNFLIHSQMPGATRVASESAWKALGRTITADQARHPIRILAPSFFVTTERDEETGEERKVRMRNPHRFVTANVYDLAQTEGKDLPEDGPAGLSGTSDEAEDLVVTIANWCRTEGIGFQAMEGLGGEGRFDGQTIVVDKDADHNQRALLFAREAARAALTRDRELFAGLNTIERELSVQGAAFAIAEGCGLDTSSVSFPAMARISAAGSAITRDERKSIERSVAAIQKITHKVLGGEAAAIAAAA